MDSICLMAVAIKGHCYAVALDGTRDLALVSSRSEPGRTHRVTRDGCDCTAFTYRRRCAHLEAVTAAQRQQQQREAVRA